MARYYTEEDIKQEKEKIEKAKMEYENKSIWEKQKIERRRKNVAQISYIVNRAMDLKHKDEIDGINLAGKEGLIERYPDEDSIRAVTKAGEPLYITNMERFVLAGLMDRRKRLSIPWRVTLDSGETVDARATAKLRLRFYIVNDEVPKNELLKTLSDWKDEIMKTAVWERDLWLNIRGINPEEEAKKRFLERVRKQEEEEAKKEQEKEQEKER